VHVDLMLDSHSWADVQRFARDAERVGFAGLQFIELSQVPWASLTAAALAAPTLQLATGIAVAFPRSPMIAAMASWELAENTGGRFRLGLGSQVRAHVQRRFGAEFDPPASRLRDYVLAVRACHAAFRGEQRLDYQGRFYQLTLLPAATAPRRHEHEHIKIDIAAVGDRMVRLAGEVADGVHVHPLHSAHYLRERLLPALHEAAAAAGRPRPELIVPVFVAPGDTPEERAHLVHRAREQVAFYGTTKNYAFQFDDLGFEGLSARLNERLKARDTDGMTNLITDEVLERFAIACPWDEVADRLVDRYGGVATRLVMYLARESIERDPSALQRWGEVARAVATR
jgi:probable F420-dependent oxidoreductase